MGRDVKGYAWGMRKEEWQKCLLHESSDPEVRETIRTEREITGEGRDDHSRVLRSAGTEVRDLDIVQVAGPLRALLAESMAARNQGRHE